MCTRSVEEIELPNSLCDGKQAVVVERAQPVSFVVAEQDGAEECALFVVGAFHLHHDGERCLAITGGVDGEGDAEVIAVVGVCRLYVEVLGGKTHPCVVGEGAGFVKQGLVAAGAEHHGGGNGPKCDMVEMFHTDGAVNCWRICIALVAAPLRRLSDTTQRLSERGCEGSRRTRPTKTSSRLCAMTGVG